MYKIIISILLLFTLTACSPEEEQTQQQPQKDEKTGLRSMNAVTIEGQLNTMKNAQELTNEMNQKTDNVNEYLESEE